MRGMPAKIRRVIQVIMGNSKDAALFSSTAMLPPKLKWPGHLRNLRPIAPR